MKLPFKMHALDALLSILVLAGKVDAQTVPGWDLIWSDEFLQTDGSQPDSAKWGYDIGGGGWGNDEIQFYPLGEQRCRKIRQKFEGRRGVRTEQKK